MDILMITHFCVLPWEKGNGRFAYIAKELTMRGHKVENVTSSFSHDEKKQRDLKESKAYISELPYGITLIDEPAYRKNVSLTRLKSHKKFAENLEQYLAKRDKPDVVYCSIPSLDAAKAAAKYCEKNGIRFIVDVQDLWPEAFKMAFNMPVVSDIVFSPMARKANKAYAAADRVITVSETYAARAMRVNKKCEKADVVYLGTDKEFFDECAACDAPQSASETAMRVISEMKNHADSGGGKKTRLAYVGTLGSSYDLNTVFAAMKKLDKEVLANTELIVMGDGPRRGEFEAAAKDLPVVFTGNLTYSEMVWVLVRCDIAINPIRRGSAGSIINKHMDYAMAGLPVVNTQESSEYRALLEKYDCGINCQCENADEVASAIAELCANPEKAAKLGENSRRMGEELFDRKATYSKIVDIVCDKTEEIK